MLPRTSVKTGLLAGLAVLLALLAPLLVDVAPARAQTASSSCRRRHLGPVNFDPTGCTATCAEGIPLDECEA